jgi:hypothetical protein
MTTGTSPSTDNLYVGKGIVSFKRTGAPSFTDLGEVPEVELTLTTTKLDYFSSRSGIRTKVKSVVLERGGTCRIRMDEFSAYNASLYFLGTVDELTPGGPTITIMDDDLIEGKLKFVGTNDVGPNWTINLDLVQINPSRSFNVINERDWGNMEVTMEILKDATTQKFGTAQITNYGNVVS